MVSLKKLLAFCCIVPLLAAAGHKAEAQQPTFSLDYAPNSVVAGVPTILTYTIDNTASSDTHANVNFSDALVAGAVIPDGSATHTCGSGVTLTAPIGGNSVSFSGATIPAGTFCIIDVPVQQDNPGTYSDSAILSVGVGGPTVTAPTTSLEVTPIPPTFTMAVADDPVFTTDSTTITFTIDNSAASNNLTDGGFTFNLPTGLSATTNGTTTCSNATMTLSGTTNFTFASVPAANFLPAGSICTVSVTVTADTTATTHSLAPSDLSSQFGGFSVSSSAPSDTLTVREPTASPTFGVVYSPSTIVAGSTSTLIYTLGNTSGNGIEEIAFTSTLAPGLTISGSGASTSCGGALSAPAGGTSFSLANGEVLPNGSCQIRVNVTGSTAGTYTSSTGDLTSTGTTLSGFDFDLIIEAATSRPTFTKSFSPSTVVLGQTSRMAFEVENTTTGFVSNVSIVDNMPTGMEIADPANVTFSSGCTPFSVDAAPGSNRFSVNNISFIASGSRCDIALDVIATNVGILANVTEPLTVGFPTNSPGAAAADLTVTGPPANSLFLSKDFLEPQVNAGDTATLRFRLQSTSRGDSATNIAFTDDLDAMLSGAVATGLPLSNVCGSGSTLSGTSTLSLTGGTLAAGDVCTFDVTVAIPAGAASGTYTNTTSSVTADLGGSAITADAASTTLSVLSAAVAAPSVSFTVTDGNPGDPVTASFVVTNNAASPLTNGAFTMGYAPPLPTTIGTTLPAANSCGAGSGFTLIAPTIDSRGFSAFGLDIPASGSCSFDFVMVLPNEFPGGTYDLTTSEITADLDGTTQTGASASASFSVGQNTNLIFNKVFTPATVVGGATTSLEFTIRNEAESTHSATAITFTDDLNTMLAGATATNLPLSNVCGTGSSLTGSAGDTLLTLTGGTLAPDEDCVFSVDILTPSVASTTTVTNTTSTLGATIDSAAQSFPAATADLTVQGLDDLPLIVTSVFSPADAVPGQAINLIYTIENPNPASFATSLFFTENLSAALSGLASPDASTSVFDQCGPAPSGSGTGFLTFVSLEVAPVTTCTITTPVNVPGGAADGAYSTDPGNVTYQFDGSTNNVPKPSAPLTVSGTPVTFTKVFENNPVEAGNQAQLTFALSNGTATDATGLSFSDDLNAMLTGATFASEFSNTCSTSPSAANDASYVSGSFDLNAGATCEITIRVNVPGTATDGSYTNVTSDLAGTLGAVALPAGNTASDDLVVTTTNTVPPTFSKAFSPATIAPGETTTLTFTIDNSDANSADLSRVTFTDDLDAWIPGATASNLPANPCGAGNVITGTGQLSFNGLSIAAGTTCTIPVTVTVPATTTGRTALNTTSDLEDNLSTLALAARASLTVTPAVDLSVTLADAPDPVLPGGTLTYTVNLANAGPDIATNVVSTFTPPAGFTVTSTSGCAEDPNGSPTCTLGSIAAGGTVSYTITGTVSGTATGSLAASVAVAGTEADLQVSNNTANTTTAVTPAADLEVTKTDGLTAITAGDTLTYTIVARNNGPVAANAATLLDSLPSDLTCTYTSVAAGGASGNSAAGAGDLAETLNLPVNGSVTYTMSCLVDINTTGTLSNTADIIANLTDLVPTNNSAVDNDTVVSAPAPLGFSKAFASASIVEGATDVLTFTLTNGTTVDATSLAFSDPLPTGLVVAPTPGETNSCGGTFAPSAGDTVLNFSGGTLDDRANCSLSVTVRAISDGTKTNTSSTLTSNFPTASAAATDSLIVTPAPGPTLTTTFSPDSINQGALTTITYRIDNSANLIDATNLSFAHDMRDGLVAAPDPAVTSTCGTFTATPGNVLTSLSGGTVAAGEICEITVSVRALEGGTITSETSNLTSSLEPSTAVQDVLTVAAATPGFAKAFSPSTIEEGETSTLTFTIDNSANAIEATTLAFSDTLPTGMVIHTAPTASTDCGGFLSAPANGGVISLSGGAVPAANSCTVTVGVRALVDGSLDNTSSVLTSSLLEAGAATATLTVTPAPAPAFSKAFSPDTIEQGAETTVTFTIDNSANAIEASSLTFSDPLPTGLVVADTPNASNTCGATFAPAAGDRTLNISGGTVSEGSTCTVTVSLRALLPGVLTNTTSDLTSSITTADPAVADLTVNAAQPAFSKVFAPDTIDQGDTSVLTFTLDNSANAIEALNLAFSDTLTGGVVVAPTPAAATDCTGATFAPNAGDTALAFSGGSLAAGASCTASVTVRGLLGGSIENTSSALTSTLLAADPATDTLNVTAAGTPTFTKLFSPDSINQGQTSVLTFTIDNTANAIEATSLAFTDPFPTGMVVADTPAPTNTCSGTFAPSAGDTSISLSGGTVAELASCELSVTVRAIAGGTLTNTTGSLSSSLNGVTSATDDLIVAPAAAPGFTKTFSPDQINQGETSVMTIAIDNSANFIEAASLAFSDSLPTGMVIPAGAVASNDCNGTVSTTETSIGLAGGTVPEAGTCSVSITVRGIGTGALMNTTTTLTSTLATAPAASDTLTVAAATPGFAKAFSPTTINQGETSTLTFTVDNTANAIEATTLAFGDTFPTGMIVADTPNASDTCGGTFAPVAAADSISYTGGTVAAGASCEISVDVRAIEAGGLENTSDPLTSSLLPTDPAVATLEVIAAQAPGFSKLFTPDTINQGQESTLTFTIDNTANAIEADTLAFSDTFPTGMIVAATPNATNTCGGTFAPVAGATSISLADGLLAEAASCTLSVNVRAIVAGPLVNTTSSLTSTIAEAAPASDTLTVNAALAPGFAKAFDPSTINQGEETTLTFTIDNTANAIEADTLAFVDTFPTGMLISTTPNVTNTCGGTVTADAEATSLTLSGGLLAEADTCEISVAVRAIVPGTLSNVTTELTSTIASAAAASADLIVTPALAPGFAKAFLPDSIEQGQESVLTFTIDNTANAIEADDLTFTDAFPTGLVVAADPNVTSTCAGTFTALAGETSVDLADGLIAEGETCTIDVTVRALGSGTLSNITTELTSTIASADPATADLEVTGASAPVFSKSFGNATIDQGQTTSLSLSIDNSANFIEADALTFSDPFPAGLVIASTPSVTNTCGGTVTATALDSTLSLAGGTVAEGESCEITVQTQALTAGALTNVTSTMTSTLPEAAAATAILNVNAVPLEQTMAFVPDTIIENNVSTLVFSLRNVAVIEATSISLSDTLPANMVIAASPDASTTCNGGTISATAGASTISYSGGSLAASASCQLRVNVTSAVVDTYTNSTDSLTSTLGASDPASATLTVIQDTIATVTFVQESDTDGVYTFTSTESLFSFLVEVNGGRGLQGPLQSQPGTFMINVAAPTGVAITSITCDDGNSVGDPTAQQITLVLDPRETVVCTVKAEDSLQKTVDVINSLLTKRANLILSSEPDSNRRIDRLQRGAGNADPLTFSNGDLKSLLPFTAQISRDTGSYKFSTSLLQARQAAASIQLAHGSTKDAIYVSNYRFDAWFEAQYKKFDNGADGQGHFAIAYLGADYLLTDDLLIGALLQVDDIEDASATNNSTARGTGWMFGPYMTARLAPNLYFDARFAAGRAQNEVSPFNTYTDSFGSDRFMAMASLTGEFQRGAIKIRPAASLSYFEETQDSYVDSVGTTIPSQKVRLGQLKIGPTFSTQFEADDGVLWAPFLTVDAIYNLGDTSGATITNQATPDTEGWRGRLKAGVTLTGETGTSLSFGATYDGIGRSDFENYGLTFDLTIPLSKPMAQ